MARLCGPDLARGPAVVDPRVIQYTRTSEVTLLDFSCKRQQIASARDVCGLSPFMCGLTAQSYLIRPRFKTCWDLGGPKEQSAALYPAEGIGKILFEATVAFDSYRSTSDTVVSPPLKKARTENLDDDFEAYLASMASPGGTSDKNHIDTALTQFESSSACHAPASVIEEAVGA